jgi:uncharacterized protein (TIGR00645 family)
VNALRRNPLHTLPPRAMLNSSANQSVGSHFVIAAHHNANFHGSHSKRMSTMKPLSGTGMRPLPFAIFASRWLQLPLYLGLIVAQCVYVFHFWVELVHLVQAVFGDLNALKILIEAVGYDLNVYDKAGNVIGQKTLQLNETIIMLVVLALIDVVMISNLLIMVIIGGYETFVARMNLENHPDQPEWLSHVNASVLKVKLATAIIGISSIHLLKTFINANNYSEKVLLWQTLIHVVFLFSAIAIALTDRLMAPAEHEAKVKDGRAKND